MPSFAKMIQTIIKLLKFNTTKLDGALFVFNLIFSFIKVFLLWVLVLVRTECGIAVYLWYVGC